MGRKRVVLVTNIPAPYREPVHELVSRALHGNYHVIYCDRREENRLWRFEYGEYSRSFLKPRVFRYRGRYMHANPDIWTQLAELDPAVVITAGYNPTFLLAFSWTILHKRRHIALTEGNIQTESHLTPLHRWLRRVVYSRSAALVGATGRALELFQRYSCDEEKIFRSFLVVDNERYGRASESHRRYDLMFSGQFIDRKMPLFFAEVATEVRRRRGHCNALLLGDGPLRDELLHALEAGGVNFEYPGFVQSIDLPDYYGSASVLLFPTLSDPWGVVANEACAAGVPVITCDNAGSAHDLVTHGYNGYVLPLEVGVWADHLERLLEDRELLQQLSANALRSVQEFTAERAAKGIVQAVEHATKSSGRLDR